MALIDPLEMSVLQIKMASKTNHPVCGIVGSLFELHKNRISPNLNGKLFYKTSYLTAIYKIDLF